MQPIRSTLPRLFDAPLRAWTAGVEAQVTDPEDPGVVIDRSISIMWRGP
jgi:hypothetical protein